MISKYPQALQILKDFIETHSQADPRRRSDVVSVGTNRSEMQKELMKHDIFMSITVIGHLMEPPNKNRKTAKNL